MKDSKTYFESFFEHWAKDRGTTEADAPLLRAMAFEFFAFGHDIAVSRIHEKAVTAVREIPAEFIADDKRFQFGL